MCLLCLGKLSEAGRRSAEFPELSHPELDRTRWAVNVLEGKAKSTPTLADDSRKHRFSIHRLPDLSAEEWLERLCDMLTACRQYELVESLRENGLSRRALGCQGSSVSANGTKSSAGHDRDNGQVLHSTQRREGVTSSFGKRLKVYKFRRRLTKLTHLASIAYLAITATQSRSLAARHGEDCCRSIRELMRQEQIRSILIVGGASKRASTEALVTSAFENGGQPSVFCISGPRRRFSGPHRTVEDHCTEWYRLSWSSQESVAAQVEAAIQQIKADHHIDMFDVLLIDGAELGSRLAAGSVLNQQLSAGHIVLLEDIDNAFNCDNYNRLINDQEYALVDYNASLRRSYAIFRKARSSDQLENTSYSVSTLVE